MKDQNVKNLPIDKFDQLARKQSLLFPDLLNFRDEEGIIDDFYEYYERRRNEKTSTM